LKKAFKMSDQRTLDGLPSEFIEALEKGRAIDEELREIIKERETLNEKELVLLELKAGVKQRAGGCNPRPETPGKAGEDKGAYPMSEKKDKPDSPGRQVLKPSVNSFQLSLFYYDTKERYSNFIELYNEIPKYVYDAPRNQKHLDSIKRKFVVDGKKYSVVLHPARVVVQEGKGKDRQLVTKELFIGTREDLVEDAVNKVAIDNKSLFTISSETRAGFLMEQIYDELKNTGHTYDRNEIKEAFSVLRGASMIIECEDGGRWEYSTYPELLLSSGKNQKGFVQMHPLASEALRLGRYRQTDYKFLMSLKGRYTRRIGKLLDSKFLWAEVAGKPFTLHLRNFLEKNGFKIYGRLSDNAKLFRQNLKELVGSQLISRYTETPTKKGKQIVDYEFNLFAGARLVHSMKRSGGIKNEIQAQIGKGKT